MKKNLFRHCIQALIFLAPVCTSAQVTIGSDKAPESFSVLELASKNERGLRLPQMTTAQRDAVEASAVFQAKKTGEAMGLRIFNTTTRCVETWNGTVWIQACPPEGPMLPFEPCETCPETGNITAFVNVMYDFQHQTLEAYNVPNVTQRQWQVKTPEGEWRNIAGANAAFYTIPERFIEIDEDSQFAGNTEYLLFRCLATSDGTRVRTPEFEMMFIHTESAGYGGIGTANPYLEIEKGGGGKFRIALLNLGQSGMDTYRNGASIGNTGGASNDAGDLGDYYQWGRQADGHQKTVWSKDASRVNQIAPMNGGNNTSATVAYNASQTYDSNGQPVPAISGFITNSTDSDWGSGLTTLWGNDTSDGTLFRAGTPWTLPENNTCPAGWRIPSSFEWWDMYRGNGATNPGNISTNAYVSTANNANDWRFRAAANNAFGGAVIINKNGEKVFLPALNKRNSLNGELLSTGSNSYWTANNNATTHKAEQSIAFSFTATYVRTGIANVRAQGNAVRCIALPPVTEIPDNTGSTEWTTNRWVGAFWKNDQQGERIIRAENASAWSVSVDENCRDWITLDEVQGDNAALWTDEPGNAEDYQITAGVSALNNRSGDILFRIGTKSTNPNPETPRYGTITLTIDGDPKSPYKLYMRQGEEADYVFRPTDLINGGTGTGEARTLAARFSPYNLTDGNLNATTALSTQTAINGGQFVEFPTQAGAFWQWGTDLTRSSYTNYLRRAYHPVSPTGAPGVWDTDYNYPAANDVWGEFTVANRLETCPSGFRRPMVQNDNTATAASASAPASGSELMQSLFYNTFDDTGANYNETNHRYFGYYADGFFDRRPVVDPVGANVHPNTAVSADNQSVAYNGLLFTNPETSASLFIPASGSRILTDGSLTNAGKHGYIWSSSANNANFGWHLSVYDSNAMQGNPARTTGLPVRCVVDESVSPVPPVTEIPDGDNVDPWANTQWVGAFWKNDQQGERIIRARNNSDWSVSVDANCADWVTLDEVRSGNAALWTDEPRNAEDYQITAGVSALENRSGDILFRIGTKSTNPNPATPRYGTVTLTVNGTAYKLFMRQGEEADYVFSPTDLINGGTGTGTARTLAAKFSPYNLTDAALNDTDVLSHQTAYQGGQFVDFPTKAGAFWQWGTDISNTATYAPYLRRAYHPVKPTGAPSVWDTDFTYPAANDVWGEFTGANRLETCPSGFRRPMVQNDNTATAPSDTGNTPANASELMQSLFYITFDDTTANRNNVNHRYFGYYADGFFDRRPVVSATGATARQNSASAVSVDTKDVAYNGLLFTNPVTNASLFIPASGARNYITNGSLYYAGLFGYAWSSSAYANNAGWGMSVSDTTSNQFDTQRTQGYTVRCVEQ